MKGVKEVISNGVMRGTKLSPARIMVFGFALVILIGAVLLTLPIATNSGESVGFLSALFTSTSAVCVTGLVVVETSLTWSTFGKVVIILLIQTGGLGFMTIATLVSLIIGRKIRLKHRIMIQESLSQDDLQGLVKLVKAVLMTTFIIEGLGALIISTVLIPIYGVVNGIGYSLFQSISAFCNAGFDLFGRSYGAFSSMTHFYNNPVMVITTGLLIIFGGLGFPVILNLYSHFKKKNIKIQLHTKLVIITTLLLVFGGMSLILILEYHNKGTLGVMSMRGKLLSAFFQSVTCRTAGFNTITLGNCKESTLFLMIILMVIGASPASTGGGIKTTTVAVIFLEIRAVLRNTEEINLFDRSISHVILRKSLAIFAIGITSVVIGTFVLTAIEPKFSLLESAFEVGSAFATVGLTLGGTPNLSDWGRIIIILFMFMGRVGSLTLFSAMLFRKLEHNKGIKYPHSNIIVG